MNKGIEWITSHPAISAIIAAAIFFATYLVSKSNSSSAAAQASQPSGVEGLSQNDLEFMQIQAGLQGQAMNDSTQVTLGQQSQQVDDLAITTSGNVANNQTSASLQGLEYETNAAENVSDQQTQAETELGSDQIQAGLEQDQMEDNLSNSALSDINDINGSQNRLSLIQSALGQQGAAEETENSYEGQAQATDEEYSSIAGAAGLGAFGL
jgi:hypothetical protein